MYKKNLRELSKNRLNVGVWLMKQFFFLYPWMMPNWKKQPYRNALFRNSLQLVIDEQQFFFVYIRVVLQRWFTIFCCCRSSPSNVQQQSHLLCHSLCLCFSSLFTLHSSSPQFSNRKNTHTTGEKKSFLFRSLSNYLHGRISWRDRRPILMFYWWYMLGNLIHFN